VNFAPNERLIVALDPTKEDLGDESVRDYVMRAAEELAPTGVTLKLNTLLRVGGYNLITEVKSFGLSVFADLKFYDIDQTLHNDGEFLNDYEPELLTACADAGRANFERLYMALDRTHLMAVLVLTTTTEDDVQAEYGPSMTIRRLMLLRAKKVEGFCDGFICAPKDLSFMRGTYGDEYQYVTPGVRPAGLEVTGDDQNPTRTDTPAGAIKAGATRIVVGRPITQAESRLDATNRIIEEIASAI